MNIFVLNCGSSSIKYQVIDMPGEKVLIHGGISRIGYDDAKFTFNARRDLVFTQPIANHEQGIDLLLKTIKQEEPSTGIGLSGIDAAGHRVVQGGSEMNVSRIIDGNILDYIESIADLAPLHNPNHIKGIRAVQKLLPDLPQVAVFDNGFHTSIPEHIYTYGINYEISRRLGIRKYGFHGIAFRSMILRAQMLLGQDLSSKKIVNMMLGSGTTANATLNGKSFEVSTGFTPQEGLIQSTRAGDMDTAAVLFMINKENLTTTEADDILNKQSGWSDLSGIGPDMYDIKQAAKKGDRRARLTIDAVAHRFRKYIGAYAAAMGGIDLLIFSGGVGENDSDMREKVCETLSFLGIALDPVANHFGKGERIISTGRVIVLVVNANEELVIAKDTYDLLS
ncbi:MAG: acetate/propionate family kinase [Eubacteriales bacterium]|nr:acetate/propionate family kinase [Eubacteriales bacterium]